MAYTRLDNDTTVVANPWRNIEITQTTQRRRDQLKSGIDDFASFTWRGVNAFDTFGAFIINKNDLKFYNGPTYSNSYTKPQFDSAYGQLTGITFNIQKIDFNIGVYWISEDHYRKLIYWLNPYEINTLTFGFEPDYFYQVKLASVSEGTRYVVGREDGRYMYYTEMKLSFEVQGPSCAYHRTQYEFNNSPTSTGAVAETSGIYYVTNTYSFDQEHQEAGNSDLPMPIEVLINAALYGDRTNTDIFYNIILEAQYAENEAITLFDITFKNLAYSSTLPNILDIKYESESGLLLLNIGDSEYMLLNQLSTSNYGKRIVDSIVVNHFEIPGTFDDCNFNMLSNLKFKVTIRSNAASDPNLVVGWINRTSFNIRARTNLI